MFAWFGLTVIVGTMVAVIVAFFFVSDGPMGDPGRLDEATVERPSDLVIPAITDVTSDWGLDAWRTVGLDPLRGGVTLHDLDGDGDLDIVAAGGALGLFEWTGGGFERHAVPQVGDPISVHVGDVDGDDNPDLLVGMADGAAIVWGSEWFTSAEPSITVLDVGGLVTGVLPVSLGGPSDVELLVLGYGGAEATPDLLIPMTGREPGNATELPDSTRKSMVAEIADIDEDGLADIRIGRDVGWATGGDSVYSRQGDAGAPWVDIAPQLGADLAVDAMGLTIADLAGDTRLDAYVSDLGDNELLLRVDAGFEPQVDSGAARIRSAEARDNEITRSWASGAADINLDGRLDLVVVNGGFDAISVQNKVVNTFILEDDPPAILLGTSDGRFYDAWIDVGFPWLGRSRGLSLGDVDGDGDTDMIVVDHGGGMHALRNDVEATGSAVRGAGCLANGSLLVFSDRGLRWSVPAHQQSFLGAHAPEVVLPPGASSGVAATC